MKEAQLIDHVAVYLTDLERSRRFDARVLEPLGHAASATMEGFVGIARGRSLRFAYPGVRERYHASYWRRT